MSFTQGDGPPLDEFAIAEIGREKERHRARLAEIEAAPPTVVSELVAEENDRHLKQLSRIYAALAERGLDERTTEGDSATSKNGA
jgi:predicted transcriptional regulator